MEMEGSGARLRLGEQPAFGELRLVPRDVLVASSDEIRDAELDCGEMIHAEHDVDGWLRCQAGNGRATDVLDLDVDRAEHIEKDGFLRFESSRPCGVVGHDLDWYPVRRHTRVCSSALFASLRYGSVSLTATLIFSS